MRLVKVTEVGDSLGIVLPEDIVAKPGIHGGQVLCLSEAVNGIELTVLAPEIRSGDAQCREDHGSLWRNPPATGEVR